MEKEIPTTAEVVRPGVVVIRRICSRLDERNVVAKLLELGDHPTDGFYEIAPDGIRMYNSTTSRGRIYRELSFFGQELSNWMLEFCDKAVEEAQKVDAAMPHMVPDHALVLYYSTNVGMREHQDSGRNDGKGDAPIVSFNFGKSVDYLVRMNKNEEKLAVRLQSGDVILFGGPARMLYHAVRICKKEKSPYPDILVDRMNLTLRFAPDILGKEHEFRRFKPSELHWKKKAKSKSKGAITEASRSKMA